MPDQMLYQKSHNQHLGPMMLNYVGQEAVELVKWLEEPARNREVMDLIPARNIYQDNLTFQFFRACLRPAGERT